jgi:aryl-alcohol dehydrogenase-like predicted oxidoreductase
VPIPGTRSIRRLEENTDATRVTLSADDLRKLDEIAPRDAVAGTRYTPGGMAVVNR